MIEALDALLLVRGTARTIVCDNGPEFVSVALDQWAHRHGITLDFIRPGHPVENCFIESFNGRLRDECLNQHHFVTLADAQKRIEAWRQEYNTDAELSWARQRAGDMIAGTGSCALAVLS